MKICVPIVEDKGLESPVSEHFGRAPMHLLVESETMQWTELPKTATCGEDETHGQCLPVSKLLQHGVEVVICKGIGRGAVSKLLSNDIAVYQTEAVTIVKAVEHWFDNQLPFVDSKRICKGHHS